jgi:hypothetical protein
MRKKKPNIDTCNTRDLEGQNEFSTTLKAYSETCDTMKGKRNREANQ